MFLFFIRFAYNISSTICVSSILFKTFKNLMSNSGSEIIRNYGKGDIVAIIIFLSTINWLSNIKSGLSEELISEETVLGATIIELHQNIKGIFWNENFLTSIWNSIVEYIMIVIFCKRQFTLNSSFFFALSLIAKNLHLPWIQNFRGLETLRDEVPMNTEFLNFFSLLFMIYLETTISNNVLNFNKRRLANCVVGSEINPLSLILKGLAVNKFFLLFGTSFRNFKYDQLHCFYLKVVVFTWIIFSHLLSLRNVGLTKKVIFKFYIFTRIFQSIKEFIENFSELNRFRKMTISLNNSMSSPTKDDMSALSDQLCIICRDEITQDTSKKLSCGHVFHIACLQNWMIRQYCCPTCLTVISSKSKDPFHNVKRNKYEQNRAKTDLLGLILGCRLNSFSELCNEKLNNTVTSLPSLEPDLASIIFSKYANSFKIRADSSIENQGNFLFLLERLCKIKDFISKNLFYFSKYNKKETNLTLQEEKKSFLWKENRILTTRKDIKKITNLIPSFTG